MKESNKFMVKIKELFESKKAVEKLLLYVGATILVAVGLVWNIYADTVLKTDSYWLFFGLLTGIAGAVFIYVGTTMNNFDVKLSGLIFNFVGCVLGFVNIAVPVLYGNAKGGLNAVIIIILVFIILGSISATAGSILQLMRKLRGSDDE